MLASVDSIGGREICSLRWVIATTAQTAKKTLRLHTRDRLSRRRGLIALDWKFPLPGNALSMGGIFD